MSTPTNSRPTARPTTRRVPTAASPAVASFPAYPVSPRVPVEESPSLSPDQIPLGSASDLELPDEAESADALGIEETLLHEEIDEEEQQRHPDSHDEESGPASVEAVADELHRRLSARRDR